MDVFEKCLKIYETSQGLRERGYYFFFRKLESPQDSEVVVNGNDFGTKWEGKTQVEYFLYGAFPFQLAGDNMLVTNGTAALDLYSLMPETPKLVATV